MRKGKNKQRKRGKDKTNIEKYNREKDIYKEEKRKEQTEEKRER